MQQHRFSWLFALLALLLSCFTGYAQRAQDSFGKNRVQHQTFDWKYLSSNNFDIYYYQGGEAVANNTARYAEAEFSRISELFGFAPYTKIKLFIYSSKADLLQSNVGLDADNTLPSATGPTTLTKSIIEIPFTGNQVDFRKEIRHGIARTLVHDMMYGGSFKDMVQSSYLLSLPEWFMSGAAMYAAEGWSVEMDDKMRDMILRKRLRKPSRLTGEEAVVAGHSIWNFIVEKYGRANVSNILNLTRIIRNEENSMFSTLGIPYDRVIRDWNNFYLSMAEQTQDNYRMPDKGNKLKAYTARGSHYNDVKMSPDGKYIAYSENNKGRYKIVVKNLETGNRRIIRREGFKVLNQRVDYNIPMLAWQSPTVLAYINLDNGKHVLHLANISKRKTEHKELGFNQISSFEISDDGTTAVFSADKNGQNDLYLYNIAKGTTQQLTNDLFDDLSPSFLPGSQAIAFSSNRISDTLSSAKVPLEKIHSHANIFIYDPAQSKQVLQRITNTVYSEIKPVATANEIFYLSDEKGILNLYRYDRNTGRKNIITDYQQNILAYDYNAARNNLSFLLLNRGKEILYVRPDINANEQLNLVRTRRQDQLHERIYQQNIALLNPEPVVQQAVEDTINIPIDATVPQQPIVFSDEIDINNYIFESEKRALTDPKPVIATPTPDPKPLRSITRQAMQQEITLRGPFPYQNRLSADNIVSSIVIDPLPRRGLGFLFQANLADLFENHKISAGVIAFSNLRSRSYFAEYEYLRYRVDYRFKFDKETLFLDQERALFHRYHLSRFEGSASYPFSVASRISVGLFYARTSFTDLTYNPTIIGASDINHNYVGTRAEYTYDNTITQGINILEGRRARVRLELFNGVGAPERNFGNIFADFRNYQRVHRDIIFATRASIGSFFGPARKNYLLGGMDNWIFNRDEVTNNPDDPLSFTPRNTTEGINKTDWLFMQYVTNLRGFNYNTVYGNSFMLFNAELRVPIVRYFYQGSINSNFLRNLQLVAFTDIGSSWSGRNPFTQDNSYNTQIIGNGSPFQVTVINYRNPFLTGYGTGVRTVVLGYFAKFDVAWGHKDNRWQQPRFYLTLGHDF
jgi:hypothetical protein